MSAEKSFAQAVAVFTNADTVNIINPYKNSNSHALWAIAVHFLFPF